MQTTVQDLHGVNLAIDFIKDADGTVNFQSIRVLGDNYVPVGPDLTDMLHQLFTLVSLNPPEGDPVLNQFVEGIKNERRA